VRSDLASTMFQTGLLQEVEAILKQIRGK
jgi:hypothetical protein